MLTLRDERTSLLVRIVSDEGEKSFVIMTPERWTDKATTLFLTGSKKRKKKKEKMKNDLFWGGWVGWGITTKLFLL